MLTFYFIRHGAKESIPFDPPLTKLGIKQAELTAKYLKNISLKSILASPKLRTRQTARMISKPHLLQFVTDDRLIERLEWESNHTFDEFVAEWIKTDLDRQYKPKKGSSSCGKGEEMGEIIEEISAKYKDGNIAIISHGGAIGDLLRYLFKEEDLVHKVAPLSGCKYIDISECSITVIQKDKDRYKLIKVNDKAHLSPLIQVPLVMNSRTSKVVMI